MLGDILLILFLLFIVVPLVRAWFFMRRVRKEVEKAQKDMFDAFNGYQQQAQKAHGKQQPEEAQQQGRTFSDEGEYAEFETIDTPRREPQQPSRRTTPHEDQITDAEFEEL